MLNLIKQLIFSLTFHTGTSTRSIRSGDIWPVCLLQLLHIAVIQNIELSMEITNIT
jgi:hypothetical protein